MFHKTLLSVIVLVYFTCTPVSFAGECPPAGQNPQQNFKNLLFGFATATENLERITLEQTLIALNLAYQLLAEYNTELTCAGSNIALQKKGLQVLNTIEYLHKNIRSQLHTLIQQGKKSEIVSFLKTMFGKAQRGSEMMMQSHVYHILGVENNTADNDSTCNPEYFTRAIHIAAQLGYQGIIQALLMQDDKVMSARNERGYLPLHCAVIGKQLSTVQLLLDAGADQSLQDAQGYTPCMLAFAVNQVDEIKNLF